MRNEFSKVEKAIGAGTILLNKREPGFQTHGVVNSDCGERMLNALPCTSILLLKENAYVQE